MTILLTGANGLLGSNLVRELLKRGHRVRAFIFPGEKTPTLAGLPIEKVEGNILHYEDLKWASYGVDAIFHLAANTSYWPSRDSNVRTVNVEGTRNVLKLCKAIRIKRLVYVGTANTFSFGSITNPGKEDTKYLGHKYGMDYMDSKYNAHLLVMAAVEDGVPAVIVNPTFMLGAYDSKPSSGTMLMAIHSKKVLGYTSGGRNFIYVNDAAVGIANALSKGRIGESYIIGNQNLTYKLAFAKMARVAQVAPPRLPFPKWAVWLYGVIGTFQGWLTNKKPTVTLPMAKISCDGHYFSAEKAVRELGLPQTPIEVGIRESLEWLKTNKYLKNA